MDIHTLFAALKPELQKVTLKNGAELYVHRPAIINFEKCTDAKSTLLYTVSNEQGQPIFSDIDEDGKINVNYIDALIVSEINGEVMKLWPKAEEPQIQDQIEKK
jgi:hypothetical protein